MEKELTKAPKVAAPPPGSPDPESVEVRANGTPAPGIRYATDEQFRKAQRKTSTVHAGLFRRLAK